METTEFVIQVIFKYATLYHCSKDLLLIWFHKSVITERRFFSCHNIQLQ